MEIEKYEPRDEREESKEIGPNHMDTLSFSKAFRYNIPPPPQSCASSCVPFSWIIEHVSPWYN